MTLMRIRFLVIVVLLLFLSACVSGCQSEEAITPDDTEPPPAPLEEKEGDQPMSDPIESAAPAQQPAEFILNSAVFLEGAPIPPKFSCHGEDISPPLAWSGAPGGTVTFAMIMDDPDAPVGTWVHWVIFNIPGNAAALEEGIPAAAEVPNGGLQGANSWGNSGYGGPCPPSGTHRYFFKLYALDAALELDKSATKEDVLAAMEGHILLETALMGTFSASGG